MLIFDADFLPKPDILEATVNYFVDPATHGRRARPGWKGSLM